MFAAHAIYTSYAAASYDAIPVRVYTHASGVFLALDVHRLASFTQQTQHCCHTFFDYLLPSMAPAGMMPVDARPLIVAWKMRGLDTSR